MLKKIQVTPRLILAILVIANLVIGLFIAGDFGLSTDETSEGGRAGLALEVYTSNVDFNPVEAYLDLGITQYYGIALSVVPRAVHEVLTPIFDFKPSSIMHYFYFIYFQMGVIAFYFLAANFMPEWSALLISTVFATQPLYFGHAFINPKDIPMMSIFLVTVAVGFHVIDSLSKQLPAQAVPGEKISRKEKRLLVLLLAAVGIVVGKGLLHPLAQNFVTYAYNAPESNLAYKIFNLFTTEGSLEGYQILTELAVYNLYRWIALLFLLVLVYFSYQVWRHDLFSGWMNLPILLAGAVWGIALSTRVVTLAAGGIVGLYGLITLKKRGIPYLVSYTLIAIGISYITWPYVWFLGIEAWLGSLLKFTEYPWVGNVLFEGQLYPQDALPASYLPKLMLLQFTEPVVILALAGTAVSIYLLIKKKVPAVKMVLVYAWFVLPLSYSILADTVNYNNFRQFLFITPPLSILAGLSLNVIVSKLDRKVFLAILIIIVLLPGLIALVELHPYQYVYYNQFTGGVAGAYRQYELDYWLTSYKEVMDYVNENIPPGSRILVWVNAQRVEIYAENEYIFKDHVNVPVENYTSLEYAIIPTTRFDDLLNLPDEEVIYEVERDGAVLAVVKRIN